MVHVAKLRGRVSYYLTISDFRFFFLGPCPNTYQIPTCFIPNNTTTTFAIHNIKDLSYCFGTGREAYKKVVLNPKNLGPDPSSPGPGSYKYLKPIGYGRLAFKFKDKIKYLDPERIA